MFSAAFSPDGGTLAMVSIDKTARLWPWGQMLIDLACALVHDLPFSEHNKQRFGIANEWSQEISAALRAKLGLDAPQPTPPAATAAR